jgi:hypothetical protein
MANEIENTLNRMKVSLKATELAGTPARGFSSSIRYWRVTLSKKVKDEEKPLRLTLSILAAEEPSMSKVIECLAADIEAGELSMWDFAQEYNRGRTDEATERMYQTCKRTCTRARRFFGDSKIARTILGIPKAA